MREFFANLLVGAGVLIATLSGLCSLAVLAASFGQIIGRSPGWDSTLLLLLIFGGIPLLVGVGLLVLGLHLLRGANRPGR